MIGRFWLLHLVTNSTLNGVLQLVLIKDSLFNQETGINNMGNDNA